MVPIEELVALARALDEATFVARHPDPALLVNPDADLGPDPGSARARPEGWLAKTQADEDAPGAPDPLEATVRLRREQPLARAAGGWADPGMTPSPEVDAGARATGGLVAFVRPGPRSMFPGMVTIGRVPNNDIVLGYRTISKVHAYLRRGPDGAWWVFDQRSTNGTLVDAQRLEPGGSRRLDDGATLHLGPSLALRFLLPPSLYGHLVGPRPPGRGAR